ncbi:cytochrome c family protein [Erythrobacter sp. JK5]|uniref:c-type cytochrome n=1 Tax=Erythrobacter sp. JK5 TaxID=2829500 RepID=UPI001BADDD63|nr:c-type cytochrome [Erythrobacter sp. JK5]QUL37998.1 cytochrome C [Erythrobacter sp. JK5]
MRKQAILAASLLTLLAACGGSEEQPPVEQIVVREPGTPVDSPAVASEGGEVDLVAAGEAAFAVCSGCHVAEAGEPSMAGPNLYGVFGRKAGALDDFAYSDALASSDIVWDNATLDRFLANPSGYAPAPAWSRAE